MEAIPLAFVRWCGNSADLLTTVYEGGRSRQVRLAGLGGRYTVEPQIREAVGRRFPHIRIDGDAVERALTVGPPHEQAATAFVNREGGQAALTHE